MSDWYSGIKSKEIESTGGGQGKIKSSQLTEEERANLDLKYPKPIGKADERPFYDKGVNRMRYKDTQKALSDGHRQFIFTASTGKPVKVLKWGSS
ncbi:hypothetical protein QNH28_16465 [Paenibacillus sp. G2S3]|uniref:hypothetical protein n=1 Tax=Paenibacillus sp. G2S3 TaxID=3047872 RepID=UPI0024C1877D|nr:hypothetical protein [Paenibacillus sp. G2S3]WHY17106.1 hypothetical protein QNH28_16465 [Paenibacillus sp. G2S3]